VTIEFDILVKRILFSSAAACQEGRKDINYELNVLFFSSNLISNCINSAYVKIIALLPIYHYETIKHAIFSEFIGCRCMYCTFEPYQNLYIAEGKRKGTCGCSILVEVV
jgi:hypothetical protein